MRKFAPIVVAFIAVVLAGSIVSAEPSIAFLKDQVLVSGVTEGGDVAWYGISIEKPSWIAQTVSRSGIGQSDRSGEFVIKLEKELPPLSIWAVVDMTSGKHALAAPEKGSFREVDGPSISPKLSNELSTTQLRDTREFMEIFLVRPQVGAWRASVGDGGASDEDRASDGGISASIESMRPVGLSAAAPTELRAGDIVVVIDPEEWEAYVTNAQLGGDE